MAKTFFSHFPPVMLDGGQMYINVLINLYLLIGDTHFVFKCFKTLSNSYIVQLPFGLPKVGLG